jgi:hypothetical protein
MIYTVNLTKYMRQLKRLKVEDDCFTLRQLVMKISSSRLMALFKETKQQLPIVLLLVVLQLELLAILEYCMVLLQQLVELLNRYYLVSVNQIRMSIT